MQSNGLDFLQPIWKMIYSDEGLEYQYDSNKGLNLSESDVEVTYTRYINTMKPPQNPKPNDKAIEEAVEAKLTPGKKFHILKISRVNLVGSATYNGGAHAMVLDTLKNNEFVFKNTYEEEK